MADKLTDSPTDSVKHRNTETLEQEITKLRWALKTKQNVIDRLLREPTLTTEEQGAIAGCTAYDEAAAATLRKLLKRLSPENPSPSQ